MATKTKTRANAKQAGKVNVNKAVTAQSTLATCLKAWRAALMGAKPSQALIEQAGSLVKRTGTAKHLALAMYMRDGGATQGEVLLATGDTQINAYGEAVRTKALNAVTSNPARAGHKVYALALPAPKAPRKPRAAKAKPVEPASTDSAN